MSRQLLAIAFISGFTLMVFELVAARIMSPFVGGTVYVWTGIIGVIIAALSLGYWFGGVIADRRKASGDLAWLLIVAAALICLNLLTYQGLLQAITETDFDMRLQATFGALLLFAPTSFILGALSPYLVKLQTTSLASTGKSVASLSAVNSIGGIIGTFIAGFFLFSWIGARETLGLLIILLVATSWLVRPSRYWQVRLLLTISLSLTVVLTLGASSHKIVSVDTKTAHYTIREWRNEKNQPIHGILSGNGGVQSGINLSKPQELAFWYTKELAKIVEANPQGRVLILGGGTFTLPQYLALKHPQLEIDVVEIDEELVELAKQYFNYQSPKNVTIIIDDARTYLNKAKARYDYVLADTYNDGEVPFTLITKEYATSLSKVLNKSAVVAVNIIAGEEGSCRALLAVTNAPYQSILGEGQFIINNPHQQLSNVVAVYGLSSELPGYKTLKFDSLQALTDNFAPTESIRQKCIDENLTTGVR